jgi:predicted nicotinamide N-methyase
VALAREVARLPLDGLRVVELGCGLALPSLAAARGGATVLATDADQVALELAERNAEVNGLAIETARVEWDSPDELLEQAPFDLLLGADILYERQGVATLLSLLPKLTPEAWLADPGRPPANAFLDEAQRRWKVETYWRGVVSVNQMLFASAPA